MCRVRDQARLVESASTRISRALGTHRAETGRIEELVNGIAQLSAESGQVLVSASEAARRLEGLAGELRAATGKFRLAENGKSSRSTGVQPAFSLVAAAA